MPALLRSAVDGWTDALLVPARTGAGASRAMTSASGPAGGVAGRGPERGAGVRGVPGKHAGGAVSVSRSGRGPGPRGGGRAPRRLTAGMEAAYRALNNWSEK